MRITRLSKALALVGLGVGSFIVGHFAMQRHSPARSVQDVAGPVAETTELRDGTPALPAAVGKTFRTAASYSTRKPLVISDGDAVIIGADASIRDARPNLGYVWAVHVFLAEDAGHEFAVFEHWFEGQPVAVKGDEAVAPILFERLPFPLPLGEYHVIVGAYRVQPDSGMAGLKEMPVGRLINRLEGPSLGTMATIGL